MFHKFRRQKPFWCPSSDYFPDKILEGTNLLEKFDKFDLYVYDKITVKTIYNIRKFLAPNAALCLVAAMAIICYAAARAPKAYGQNKNLWCRAVSAKIVAENNGGSWIDDSVAVLSDTSGLHSYGGVLYYGVSASGAYTADGVQYKILIEVKGSDGNIGGSDSDKEGALVYAASRNMSVGTFGKYNSALSSAQIQDIKDDLDNGNYVIGNMYNVDFSGHSVVIKDYDSSDRFRIHDPWNLTDMYYSSSVFSSASFPIAGYKARIEWIQYCR